MLKANELRIGNWVNYTSDISSQTSPIQIDWIWFVNEADQNCSSPIILTHEILEKCGFKMNDRKWRIEDVDALYLYGSNGFYAPYVMPEIKHLHQLQNLYFALTGKELNINL